MSIESPPKEIPAELIKSFTLNNIIPVYNWYIDNSVSDTLEWTPELIDKFLKRYTAYNITNNIEINLPYPEGEPYTNASLFNLTAINKYKSNIENKNIAVIGSLLPWLEAIIINMGAKSVTTIEYNKPTSTKLIKTISYEEFTKSEDRYDTIFSYSSIEHSGLGRYGDPLNPNGDIETMYHVRTHLVDNGLAIIGVPVGKDAVVWNAHRVYGEIRLPLVFSGFKELEWIGVDKSFIYNCSPHNNGPQPVIVLKKI